MSIKTIIAAIAFSFLMTTVAHATQIVNIVPVESGSYLLTSEVLSVLASGTTTFTALSSANRDKFREAHIYTTQGGTVNIRFDGTAPTTGGAGLPIANGYGLVIRNVGDYQKLQIITDSSSSGSSVFGVVYGR